MRIGRRVLAVAAVAAMTGCGGGNTLGTLESILGSVMGQPGAGGGGSGQLAVEIQSVNAQQQAIQVRTQEGQTGAVRYDQNTVVVYQQQQYPVTALERGDLVVMQLQDVQGTLYTARIDVTQSVRERTGTTGTGSSNLVQVAGRISSIDHNAGRFVVQMQNGSVTVSLPYNTPQATVEYFHRLRVNDNVRLEARPIETGRVEIYRFL